MGRNNAIRTIIFDLDDTLIQTSKIYHQARDEFARIMSSLGFPREEVLEKLDEIDIKHIQEQGFAKERYPLSLIKTYHYYCECSGEKIDLQTEKEIAAIGWKVFQQIPEQVEGADLVLNNLKGRYLLILATLGDPEIQHQKIRYSGLQSYFSAIYVLNYKTAEEYLQIIKQHNLKKEKTWIIGNSIRSDLNPGLELGLNCILIPAPTWKFEEEKPISNHYLQLKSLVEVLNYL
ncbi:MAG: HAD family hydrolase [Candidatus Caldatribacteriota bacterium]|nr:HAD family hydrolase [Candidatus Atribacteria bacterium]